jgi:hypothetical protein
MTIRIDTTNEKWTGIPDLDKLWSAVADATDGQIEMTQEGNTVRAKLNIRAVAERLYARGVRA